MPAEENGAQRPPAKLAVPVVVGTRPEAIKLVPILLALRDSDCFRPIIVSTGQHHQMVEEIFAIAGLERDATLYAGDRHSRLNERVSSVMRRFEDFVEETFGPEPSEEVRGEKMLAGEYPVCTFVHGDTSSAMAAALSSFHLHIPVVHVEAGLRTGGLNLTPFPEELNRQVITCIAALNFAPTTRNLENLVRESVPTNQIFVTGNTAIDALSWASALEVPYSDPVIADADESGKRIVVVTAHRRENWGDRLVSIAAGVADLAGTHPDDLFIVPMHPNPSVRETLRGPLESCANVLLVEPPGYAEFARLLGRSHLVITDSGGIQEEAPALDKPVLVTRDSTERTEGIDGGTLKLVGADPRRIVEEGGRLLDDPKAYERMARAANPYGDGRAAERILGALNHLLKGGDPPNEFGPGYSRRAVALAFGFNPHLTPGEEELLARLAEPRSQLPGTELWHG
jgi:UDP-N-acetylglucosamine 2-epimerase (non-hydrolysing)